MGNFLYPNRDKIQAQFGAFLTEALDAIQNAHNQVFTKSSMAPVGESAVPAPIANLSVTGGNGVYQAVIQDNSSVTWGISYFLEYSDTANFASPHVIPLGPARTWRGTLNLPGLYWRAYSQYQGGQPSAVVYYGSQTTPVVVTAGGAISPVLPGSTGSGTASGNGTQGGSGYGKVSKRESS